MVTAPDTVTVERQDLALALDPYRGVHGGPDLLAALTRLRAAVDAPAPTRSSTLADYRARVTDLDTGICTRHHAVLDQFQAQIRAQWATSLGIDITASATAELVLCTLWFLHLRVAQSHAAGNLTDDQLDAISAVLTNTSRVVARWTAAAPT